MLHPSPHSCDVALGNSGPLKLEVKNVSFFTSANSHSQNDAQATKNCEKPAQSKCGTWKSTLKRRKDTKGRI